MTKKIGRALLTAIFFILLSRPGFVFAQGTDSTIPQNNPLCWTEDACKTKRQQMLGGAAGSTDGGWVQEEPCTGDYGKCLPVGVTKTQITFGGQNSFTNAGDFIKNIYNYSLVIIQILAVVVIIIAGAQWASSGGNAESISRAKKRITGAVIGMIIALMSYTILKTINPATVSLRMPQVWLIASDEERYQIEVGEPCDPTGSDDTKARCEKDGKKYCEPIAADNEGPCFTVAYYTAEAATIVMTAGAGTGVSAASKAAQIAGAAGKRVLSLGGKSILKYGLKIPVEKFAKYAAEGAAKKAIAKEAGKVVFANVTRTGSKAVIGCSAVAGYATGDYLLCGKAMIAGAEYAIDELGDFDDHNGICFEKVELYNGDMCEINKTTCAGGGKCVKVDGFSEMAKCWANADVGFCSDGESGSICESDSDCKEGNVCIEDQYVRQCSDGREGSPCSEDDECKSKICNIRQMAGLTDVAVGMCASTGGVGEEGDFCKTNANCDSELACYTLAWSGNACVIRKYTTFDDNDYRNNTVTMLKDAGGQLKFTGGLCMDDPNDLKSTLSSKGLKVSAYSSGGGSYEAGWYYCE